MTPGAATVNVTARGGSGTDTFAFRYGEHRENILIADFTAGDGGDVLDLMALFEYRFPNGNPFGSNGVLRLVQQGSDTLLQYDADGALGKVSTFATIATLANVSATSLVAANFTEALHPDGSNLGVTLTGTDGNDRLTGSFLDDTLIGLAGSDNIEGRNGDDLIYAGDGDDYVSAGPGADRVEGGAGADTLDAGQGDDTLEGNAAMTT